VRKYGHESAATDYVFRIARCGEPDEIAKLLALPAMPVFCWMTDDPSDGRLRGNSIKSTKGLGDTSVLL
jgi:hypothetical protein